jgi:hypothetical protein
MKRLSAVIVASSLLLGLAVSVPAQQIGTTTTGDPTTTTQHKKGKKHHHKGKHHKKTNRQTPAAQDQGKAKQ